MGWRGRRRRIYDVPLKALVGLRASGFGRFWSALPRSRLKEPHFWSSVSAGCTRTKIQSITGRKLRIRLPLLDQRPIQQCRRRDELRLCGDGANRTHVFDMDCWGAAGSIIRKARDGEELKTLGWGGAHANFGNLVGAERKSRRTCRRWALRTMITDKTRDILIESAWWDPGDGAQTSRRHGLHHRRSQPVWNAERISSRPICRCIWWRR